RRESNPSDRRSYIVRLTREGHALWERLVPVVLELNTEVYGKLDPDYLQRMTRTVQELQTTYNTVLRA
ncbi:MAG: hypothetical protein H6Q00_3197, partial [Holophagaceae bacterium]|nr:hypothetical protein [Holophagaceae bacterium]